MGWKIWWSSQGTLDWCTRWLLWGWEGIQWPWWIEGHFQWTWRKESLQYPSVVGVGVTTWAAQSREEESRIKSTQQVCIVGKSTHWVE